MKHYWIDENKKYGFYIVGYFERGKRWKWDVMKEKPFEIDSIEGTIEGKCISCIPRNKFVTDWFFMEGYKMSDIKKEESIKEIIREIIQSWCEKHRKKYVDIFKKENEPETT